MSNAMRETVAALLRSRGYTHDDATDPDDMHWYGPTLGVRPMLVCLAHEINRDGPGKCSGFNTYDVSLAVPVRDYAAATPG